MKYSPRFTYTFTPGSSTLDLSATANAFNIKGLLAVVNATVGATIYAIGTTGLGYNSLSGGNILTLQAAMTGMASGDNLIFFYDDGTSTGKDSRTTITAYSEAIAGATTETLFTLQVSSGFATVAGATSYTVPAGKTLRLTAMTITYAATSAALNTSRVRIRVNPSGSALITSTIVWSARLGFDTATAASNQTESAQVAIPDGLEIPGGGGIAVSHVETAAAGSIDLCLTGFIY